MEKGPLKAPISLQVELTDNCNHLCKHCYNFVRYRNNGNRIVSKPVDIGKLEMITGNIIRNEVFHVTLSGGEPALLGTANLEKIIKRYKEHKVQVTVNSNLSFLPDTMVDMFAYYNIKILTSVVSYDPNTFNRIVNNKSASENLICVGHTEMFSSL